MASWVDRAQALVYLACAITLGAKHISDAERRRHHHAALGLSGGSDSTIWRLLDGIDDRLAGKIAGTRAAARKIAWSLISVREQGFPWVEIAGKTLTGWIVIDMDATIVESSSKQEGAAGTFKGSFGHHPRGRHMALEPSIRLLLAGPHRPARPRNLNRDPYPTNPPQKGAVAASAQIRASPGATATHSGPTKPQQSRDKPG